MVAAPKDEVAKREADGAHKKRGRQNQTPSAAVPLMSRAPSTLGQQEKAERGEFQKRVHRKKIHDAREAD